MLVLSRKEDVQALHLKGVAVTVGSFDGLHRGHQHLIAGLKKNANGAKTAVITFDPHPERIVSSTPPLQIFDREDQIQVLEQLGIDYLFFIPFNKDLSELDARVFAEEYIFSLFQPSVVVVGYDFAFGKNRSGDLSLLLQMTSNSAHAGTKVLKMEPLFDENEIISSSLIRKNILAGHVERAKELLGRSFYVIGRVVEGKKLGRQLGFPTANLLLKGELSPGHGVYFCLVIWQGKSYPAVCNVGVNPTVSNTQSLKVECHILNFKQDIYQQNLKVEFIKKIRNEMKFANVESLRKQIADDIALALTFVQKIF